MDKENKITPLDGYYIHTLDWVEEYMSDQNLVKNFYKEIYPDETCHLLDPKGIEPIHPAFTYKETRSFPRAFVAIIPNGRVWGPHGTIITPNHKLLWDVSLEWPSDLPPEQYPIFQQRELPAVTYLEGTVASLSFVGTPSYYHWFFDVLPRIHLLKESGISIDNYIINTHSSFQYETLALLGIPREKIIQNTDDTNFHLQAKNLVVTSVPNRSRYPKWEFDFLRNEFLNNQHINRLTEFERIYISREDAHYRNVLNEDEVMHVLARYGFKKVVLSHLSLSEKINMFASTKIVVSALGSGLVHLLFCDPGTKVIEFLPPNFVDICFWRISNFLNLDYYYLMAEGRGFPNVPDYDSLMEIGALGRIENIHIDINKLFGVLERAGL